jgi:hypothetical protein
MTGPEPTVPVTGSPRVKLIEPPEFPNMVPAVATTSCASEARLPNKHSGRIQVFFFDPFVFFNQYEIKLEGDFRTGTQTGWIREKGSASN